MDIGPTELLIILLIVIVLFGAGRVASLGKDLGTAIREFRRGFKDDPAPANEPPPSGDPQAAERQPTPAAPIEPDSGR